VFPFPWFLPVGSSIPLDETSRGELGLPSIHSSGKNPFFGTLPGRVDDSFIGLSVVSPKVSRSAVPDRTTPNFSPPSPAPYAFLSLRASLGIFSGAKFSPERALVSPCSRDCRVISFPYLFFLNILPPWWMTSGNFLRSFLPDMGIALPFTSKIVYFRILVIYDFFSNPGCFARFFLVLVFVGKKVQRT